MKNNKSIEKFNKTLEKLIDKGDKLLVMLSGGADSVFLINLLCLAREFFNIEIFAMHLNHNFRGEDANLDERFCRKVCEKLNVELFAFNEDIFKYAKENKLSNEAAGRVRRYTLASEIAREKNIDKILTGHHKDDNVESILMNIIRGCGLEGLTGIKIKMDNIIRLLLDFTKDEILDYLSENNIKYVEDKTNFDNEYTRNRVRNEIIPLLKNENNNFLNNIVNLSKISNQTLDFIEQCIKEININKSNENSCCIDFDDFINSHEALKPYIILKMAKELNIISDISSININDVIQMCKNNKTTWDIDIKHLIFYRRYDKLLCKKNDETIKDDSFYYEIKNTDAIYIFPKEKFNITIQKAKKNKKILNKKFIINIDYDKINRLYIRNRVSTDKIIFSNMSKSVKKFLIEKKIPKEIRNSLPILINENKIISILGVATSAEAKIDEHTINNLCIKYDYWE